MSTPKPSAAVINAYLNFNGRCEEAVEFYKSAIGAQPSDDGCSGLSLKRSIISTCAPIADL